MHLALGFELGGLETEVSAVRASTVHVRIDEGHLGEGYGIPSASGTAALLPANLREYARQRP